MKKINLLIAIAMLMFVSSCDKDEKDEQNAFETTDVMAVIESGDNAASRGVNRPGSVLDFIDTIEITADHVMTIGPAYSVSELYTMVDDNSGDVNFILEDVALGRNKFTAYAKSYEQTPAEEWVWVLDEADEPWAWIDAQRGRHPNVNFYDNDNDPQVIYENPSAGENVVNFNMQAESGRLIVAIRLGEKIRTTFNSNYVYVRHNVEYADGTSSGWSAHEMFNPNYKDDLLTFYFSDNGKSKEDACVQFKFFICDDERPGIVTNEFFREICLENGKSIGCVYEIEEDAVIEDVTNFNFSFDWEEVDCAPCPSNQYITTVPRGDALSDAVKVLCNLPAGSVHGITQDFPELIVANSTGAILQQNPDGSWSDVMLFTNGLDEAVVATWNVGGANSSFTIPANRATLVKLGDNVEVADFIFDNAGSITFNTGSIQGCN